MTLSEGESLNAGKNTEGNLSETMVEGHGNFHMTILAIPLPDGEALLCHLMVTLIEWTFVKTTLPCGLLSKVQGSRLGLAKDSEKAHLNLTDFTAMDLLTEGDILWETLKVNECVLP